MSKRTSTLANMLLALVVIAVVAAGALAGVYALTKDPIEQEKQKTVQKAMNDVLPKFDSKNGKIETVNVTAKQGDKQDVTVNLAYNADGSLFGAAVETYTDKAFSGTFTIMVGFDAEGTIIGTSVIKASETPGLGDKIKTEEFSGQFAKKNMNPKAAKFDIMVSKDGGEVDAITAATISSRAFCDAVNRAAKGYDEVLKKKGVTK